MQIDDHLEAIKHSVDGCSLVAYGDLQTGLILRFAAQDRPSQDWLNQICSEARYAFRTLDALMRCDVYDALGHDTATAMTSDACSVYVRSTANDSDVLCCICDDRKMARALVDQSRAVLRYLA